MSTTWDLQEKSGSSWGYNETNLTYDEAIDPDGGLPVYYNSVGLSATYTLQDKS